MCVKSMVAGGARATRGYRLHVRERDDRNVVLRAIDRTLTHAECNVLRDEIYAALHCGTVSEWAAR